MLEKIKLNISSDFNSGFVIVLPQLLIQILEEDYLYEQLYDGLKMEGTLKGIAILLLKASFIASSKLFASFSKFEASW